MLLSSPVRQVLGLAALTLCVTVLAACGWAVPSSSLVTSSRPQPAGPKPTLLAAEVCSKKAQTLINETLGVTATVTDVMWVAHRYSCRYSYPKGSFEISIKELSSWSETLGYFRALGSHFGVAETLANLGQGAYQTTNGDVVVRKDWKVLLVDIAELPPQFGAPPAASADDAYTVADIILACWAGD